MLDPEMIVTAWRGGRGYVYGLRVLGNGRWLYFRQEWSEITLIFPDDPEPATIPISPSFWERSPELRSPHIKAFLFRNGLDSWPKHHPPHFQLEPLGGGRFRLGWLEHVPRQPVLLV